MCTDSEYAFHFCVGGPSLQKFANLNFFVLFYSNFSYNICHIELNHSTLKHISEVFVYRQYHENFHDNITKNCVFPQFLLPCTKVRVLEVIILKNIKCMFVFFIHPSVLVRSWNLINTLCIFYYKWCSTKNIILRCSNFIL